MNRTVVYCERCSAFEATWCTNSGDLCTLCSNRETVLAWLFNAWWHLHRWTLPNYMRPIEAG